MVAFKMASRHSGGWSTYPPRNLIVLLIAWVITASLLGVVATRWERMRSWGLLTMGTVAGSFLIMGAMLMTMQLSQGSVPQQKFASTDAMMEHLANEAAGWVKKDRGINLDYSVESIQVIEEELGRIEKEIDKEKPQQGTFGLAMGYGAYIGEVFRRRDGGSWAQDHPNGGEQSFPMTTKSNVTIFPVGWCWKRLTVGEEDNVYLKARLVSEPLNVVTNVPALNSETIEPEAK